MAIKHGLFETKSLRLFAMLFGFGFYLQMKKAAGRSRSFAVFFVRRLVILFAIGMAHALLYDGDILLEYAALGLLLIPLRSLSRRALLVLAIVLLASFSAGNAFVSLTQNAQRADPEEMLSLDERRRDHPYLGSLAQAARANAEAIPPPLLTDLHSPESSLAVFAMFLLGLYVGRRRILHDPHQHRTLIRRAMIWGLSIGLTSTVLEQALTHRFGYRVFADQPAPLAVQIIGDTLYAYGSTALSLGYAATIVVLSQIAPRMWLLAELGHLGRLALTAYVSGSLLFTMLFYGYGFGQLFLLGPAATTAFAVLFFSLQIGFAAWWARHYRFGPLEWLWRSATYGWLQPNRGGARRRP